MKKSKKLIIMNGRWIEKGKSCHIYIAAYSIADACRICTKLSGHSRGWYYEIKEYFSIGCWGNPMNDIKIERGAWIQERDSEKPKRVL